MLRAIAGAKVKPFSLWLAGLGALFLLLTIASQIFAPQRPMPVVVPETWFVHSGTPLVGFHGKNGVSVFTHLFTSERAMYLALGVNPKKVDAYIAFQHKVHDSNAWLTTPQTQIYNPYLYFRKDAPWAYGATVGASLATIDPANAFHRGTRISASVIATGCSAYPNDNGCANAQPGVIGFQPGAQNTNFAFDVAQVGQVLPSANPGFAASLAAYTAILHTVGDNEPYWDYRNGSSCNTTPASCAAINTFVADGFCKWWSGSDAAGPDFASNPWYAGADYFFCREQGGSTGLNYVLANWDLANGAAAFTGVEIFPINSNPHNMTLRNFYMDCTGSCASTGTAQGGLIWTPSAGGANPPNVELDFWTIDGGQPSQTGIRAGGSYVWKDNRPGNAATTITYMAIKNLGGDPIQSGGSGDLSIIYSTCWDCATLGAHGEWAQPTGNSFTRNYNFTGDSFFFAANYCAATCASNNKKDMTSPIYDAGNSIGNLFNNFIIHHQLNLLMPVNCATTGARVPPYNPDNLANNCSGGGDASLFDLNGTARVQTGDFAGNFADREIGDLGYYRTLLEPVGAGGFQAGSLVTVTAGDTVSLTASPVSPGGNGLSMYTGAWLHSFGHNAPLTGAIAANTLTVSLSGSQTKTTIRPGFTTISGVGVTSALVTAQLTGTTGGAGTYTINGSPQTVSSVAMNADDGFFDNRMLMTYGPNVEVGAGTWNPFATFGGTNTTTVLTITNPAGGLNMVGGTTIIPTNTDGTLAAGSRGTINGTQTGTSINLSSGVAYSGGLYANQNLTLNCTPGFQNSCGTIKLAASGEPLLTQNDGQTWAYYPSFATVTVSPTDPSYWVYYGTSVTTPQLVTFSGLNTPAAYGGSTL